VVLETLIQRSNGCFGWQVDGDALQVHVPDTWKAQPDKTPDWLMELFGTDAAGNGVCALRALSF